jgi:hypothetical protein
MSARKKHRETAPAKALAQTDCASVPTSAEFCAQLRRHLAAELEKPCVDDASVTNFQALSAKLVQMAVKGSKDAIQIVLDRTAGRTPQAAAGNEGPANIEYVFGIPRPDYEQPIDATPAGGIPTVPPAE